ncbi:DUF2213 domain-containing protein [Sphingomonas sp.]|uniref:DUF2213 domain-containing protein n=1 Tax=Sphingomonas sp. TaxID=28214 RepID=UPI003B3A46D4
MQFNDRAFIDGPARITREGHFVARARVARANNIQDYQPHELGLPPKADGTPYRIFRPEASIFAKDSLHTALHRPIVMDHPKEDVTAANWKELSVGDTGGEIMRDGDTMVVPIMIMDAKGVAAVQTTHPEFSWGYGADLEMTPGKFGDEAFDGSITPPRYNHLAMCGRARGGSDLRVTDSLVIIDERPAHLRDQEKPTMKIKIGDAEVDLSDGAAVALAVGSLNTTLSDALNRATPAESTVAAHVTTIAAKDAEIATLTQAVKDATLTPQQKVEAGKAFAKLVTDAQRIAPTAGITDAMDEATIRKTAVMARLGDAAKGWTDAQYETSFATSLALIGDAGTDTIRDGLIQQPANIGDARANVASARKTWLAGKENAHAATAA